MNRSIGPMVLVLAGWAFAAGAQDDRMSFFITSENPGAGGDLGGLEGADAHCAALADAAGATGRTWRAYLSTSSENARDRIGSGPWHNFEGVEIAAGLDQLHGENNIDGDTALDEAGNRIPGRGESPNIHDILTGTMEDGTAAPDTCEDWTTSSDDSSAMVGHHDRLGPETLPTGTSWLAAHPSQGCGMDALRSTGGAGLFYCFAAD